MPNVLLIKVSMVKVLLSKYVYGGGGLVCSSRISEWPWCNYAAPSAPPPPHLSAALPWQQPFTAK